MAHGDLPRAGGPAANAARDPEAHGRRTGRAVFGLLLMLYGITAGGSLTSTDSVVTFELTRQMVAHGSLALPTNMLGKEAMRGRDGRYYSPFGLAQAVFNIPFYVAAVTLERAGVRVGREDSLAKAFVALSSAVAAAAAIWALYVFAWRLTRSSSAAARLALVVGVGTPLWPYSKFGFNAPLAAWFTTSAVYFAWRADREGRLRDAVFAGAFVGLALLTRHELALLLLPILLLHATTRDASVRAPGAIATLAGVTPALLLWLAYNALRFGNPLDTGYMRDSTSAFGSSVWTGLYGLLCSPAASLFVYCPLAVWRCRGTRVAVAAGSSNGCAPRRHRHPGRAVLRTAWQLDRRTFVWAALSRSHRAVAAAAAGVAIRAGETARPRAGGALCSQRRRPGARCAGGLRQSERGERTRERRANEKRTCRRLEHIAARPQLPGSDRLDAAGT